MNLHALRIFNDVSKTGSITRSAQNLLLSQPAVTAQIRNLERELGLKLVEAREGISVLPKQGSFWLSIRSGYSQWKLKSRASWLR